jgi:hypothetical protein
MCIISMTWVMSKDNAVVEFILSGNFKNIKSGEKKLKKYYKKIVNALSNGKSIRGLLPNSISLESNISTPGLSYGFDEKTVVIKTIRTKKMK